MQKSFKINYSWNQGSVTDKLKRISVFVKRLLSPFQRKYQSRWLRGQGGLWYHSGWILLNLSDDKQLYTLGTIRNFGRRESWTTLAKDICGAWETDSRSGATPTVLDISDRALFRSLKLQFPTQNIVRTMPQVILEPPLRSGDPYFLKKYMLGIINVLRSLSPLPKSSLAVDVDLVFVFIDRTQPSAKKPAAVCSIAAAGSCSHSVTTFFVSISLLTPDCMSSFQVLHK